MNNNFEGLLRSLLVQLLDAMPELREYAPSEASTYWHEARLRECLLSVFDHSSKGLCLFLDGLDEYEGNLLQLLRFLTKLQTVGENSQIPRKIYVSSRPEPVPSQLLEGTPSLSMSEENHRGIHAYIQSIMRDMPSKIAEDPQWRTLCDEIVDRADGVFLWARFALNELVQGYCKGESTDELSARLESVPDELEGIYKRIVDRMEPQAREEALIMLQITCCTPRSLVLQEFLVAMTFTMDTDPSIREFIGHSELRMFFRRVPAKVGGLLEIIKKGNERGNSHERDIAEDKLDKDIDEEGNEEREESLKILEVKLTHKTVKTFLDRCGWQLLQPQTQILPYHGDLLILKACSKYLKQIFDPLHCYGNESPVDKYVPLKHTDRKTLYPFLAYSASTLFYHARRLEILGNVSSYAYIKEVLTPKFGAIHLAGAYGHSTCQCCKDSLVEKYPYNVTSPIAHGLPKTCEIICTHTGDENFSIDEALNEAILSTYWGASEPNFLACCLNNISLVLSKITQIKQSHLERAMAVPAPVDVLRLLLGHQSFENVQIFRDDGQRATLLWLLFNSKIDIAREGDLAAGLKLLIEKGEDVNEQCGPHGTALDYAVRLDRRYALVCMIEALVYYGAYKTVNPHSLSKPIMIYDARGEYRATTLGTYLAGEDGFSPHRGSTQASRGSGAGLLLNNA